ncbi:hypothetical protein JCM6882_003487 [Rhodosporidiobolus microsporus]
MTCVYSPPASPSGSPFTAPSSFLPPRSSSEGLSRRPSALRSPASDHIITHAITRFNQRDTVIPTLSQPPSPSARSEARQVPPPTSARLPPPIPSVSSTTTSTTFKPPSPPHRPAPHPLPSSASGGSSGSLLARRRSSRSAARADVLPMLNDLKLEALPTAALEELDDTVRPQVVGESSAAVTPSKEALSPGKSETVVVKPFKSTKVFVPTPFPTKRADWLSDEDDEDEDEDDESAASSPVKKDAGAATGASKEEK